MKLTSVFAVVLTSALIALVAWLVGLSTILPEPAAYFAIALLAASLGLLLNDQLGDDSAAQKTGTKKTRKHKKNQDRERGKVKWFNSRKGFGFITRENGEEIFVHFRAIAGNDPRALRDGQKVEYLVTEGSKGLQADEVIALK